MSSVKEFDHLRVPLKDILEATNNFSDDNLIGRGTSATVYKGPLFHNKEWMNVAVRRLDSNFGQLGDVDVELFTEISILPSLKHDNLISIIGFCDEEDERIIVKKHEENKSLDKHVRSQSLSWMKRLEICLGAACGLSYLHHNEGRNYGIIHRNIKSSKILLDENWIAKISGFEHSVVNPSRRKHRLLLSPTLGTSAYVDPVSIQTGSVTYKSDSYSFGMVLFEVLCGRLCRIDEDDEEQRIVAPLVKHHYEDKKLDEIIPVYLKKQMNDKSLSVFSETAYYCLKEQRTQRPDMDQIARKLYKALDYQRKHENPETPLATFRTWSTHVKENFEHLKIPLEDIKLATNHFDQLKCIGQGGYSKVYIAELEYFDNKVQRSDENGVTKTRNTVAIKCILSRQDTLGEQGFLTEIEMLTSCNHPNVVSLLGYCDEGEDKILIYEYASNGSLDDYIGSTDKITNFTWIERLRICLYIAQGLNYLHTKDEQRIIHRDIKSANILLDHKWIPKIADFGLSKFGPMNQEVSYLNTSTIAGTSVYLDPEYAKTGKLKNESDIYSFGVVLFEILCGRLAYDGIYYLNNDKGLPSVARRCFNEKTLKEIIDQKVMEETDENVFTLNKGPNEESLNVFSKIAYKCLAETQDKRPTMEVVIRELQKAIDFQVNCVDILKISQKQILLATENFNTENLIGRGAFGDVYKGEVVQAHKRNTVAVKRHVAIRGQGEQEFLTELEILFEYKHENVIGLIGYYNEMEERIIVYEHAINGSVDKHLSDVNLSWAKRILICIDVANGLNFLHGGVGGEEMVIHRDIKSSNILLNGNWRAKISDFGLSIISPINQHMNIICNPVGTPGYVDRDYVETGYLTKECDIFSLGVLLLEIMCGRQVFFIQNGKYQSLEILFKRSFEEGNLDELVFPGIKPKIVPKSLVLFSKIVYQCLHDDRKQRPTAEQVIIQLKEALEIQKDYDIWEPKLPKDYKELIKMSKFPGIYPTENKRVLYNMLSKGLLLANQKVWFSLNVDGLRKEMISATVFSFKNVHSCKWIFTPNSRFSTVAEMSDILDMKIEVNITPQFLTSNIMYGAYLVFKFCDPRKMSNKLAYVNLKYKIGSQTLHSYFATWRDEEWMMIMLDTFLSQKDATKFKVLLESFSQYCCGSGSIYVDGIEFRPIDHVKHEEHKRLKREQEVLKSNSNSNSNSNVNAEKLFSSTKVTEKKWHVLSAKRVLYDHSNMKCFKWIHLVESRFEHVAELLARQVFWIKCKIESESLSLDTDYACYLVFKLSQKWYDLQHPVKVRDVLLKQNRETRNIYFRFPSLVNVDDIRKVPNQREDGLMEVNVWEFNSSKNLKNDHVLVNLKLRCYEGTMSGLTICGIEFRPI